MPANTRIDVSLFTYDTPCAKGHFLNFGLGTWNKMCTDAAEAVLFDGRVTFENTWDKARRFLVHYKTARNARFAYGFDIAVVVKPTRTEVVVVDGGGERPKCGTRDVDTHRIVGGNEAIPGEFPWKAFLLTLIGDRKLRMMPHLCEIMDA